MAVTVAMDARIEIKDGLIELRKVISLKDIARLIEQTARWVAPETFKLLPVWYPEHRRRGAFYKANWTEPLTNTSKITGNSIHKLEANVYASKALTKALGLNAKGRPNWSCCHIWGVDDATFQLANAVVMDRRFYSCPANMVLLPTPLKAFTDAMPEIKTMLRICARNLYGWQCDHEAVADAVRAMDNWADWDAYPSSWLRKTGEKRPLGTVPLTAEIEKSAHRRLATIRREFESAGPYYPREEVRSAMAYWHIAL